MKHLVRIDAQVTDGKRWVYHNDRKSHQIDEASLQAAVAEAGQNLWCDYPVHGQKLGKQLYGFLNGSGGLLRNLQREHRDHGEHTTLGLQLPEDLMNLPFEIMWDGDEFFSLSSGIPIVRQVSDKNRFKDRKLEDRPINMLFMACSPQDTHAPLSFETEEEAILKVLEDEKLPVDFHVEDSGWLGGLKFTLREHGPYDVLHLTGHAGITKKGPVFQMESETGFSAPVAPSELLSAMRNSQPSVVFLSGCETGKTGMEGMGSFAQELVRQGVSCVIGWGLKVYHRCAILFGRSLYRGLGEGLPVDEAVIQACQEITTDFQTWSILRVFCDGTPLGAITDPSERVVRRSKRMERYRYLLDSQVKVLEYGFVGRRRQVQRGVQVLKGDLPDKNGLLVTGTAGVGKSTLTGKLVERFPGRELMVISGVISQAEVLNKLELLFDKKGHKEGLERLRSNEPYDEKVKGVFRGALAKVPVLMILDDFEQNLEQQGDEFWLKGDSGQVLLPILEALSWAEGKTQLIITSRYPFVLEANGKEWVGTSLERIPLLALRGADLEKKKQTLSNIRKNPHLKLFLEFSGGNPRLLEWFETLAKQGAALDAVKLEADLGKKSEEFIQKYLAKVLIDNQALEFREFLSKASVYRTPEKAGAFALLGSAELLERAVNLTLMEMEGSEDPVYWVMPLIRDELWSKVDDASAVHRLAYDWYDSKMKKGERLVYGDLDSCLYHGEHGHSMEGCWGHATVASKFFQHSALFREGASRLKQLYYCFPEKDDASYSDDETSFLNNLAQLLQETNRLSEAEPLMRRALAIDEASYGEDHPKVATHLSNLASLLQETNRLHESEQLMRRALQIDEAFYGEDHPDVAIRLNNLALLLRYTNRLSEAEPLMRRALQINEAFFGENHPNIAIHLNNLASLLQETNRLSEAEPLMRRALKMAEKSHGKDHPSVAISLNNLALLLRTTNRLSEAEPLMRRALEMEEKYYDKDHPRVAVNLNNLASLLQDTDRHSEAEPLMRRALQIEEKSHGKDHPRVAVNLNNLASFLQDTDRHSEAEPLMRRALQIEEKSHGKDHPRVAINLNNLALLLRMTNRLTDAEPLMRRALQIEERSHGKDHPRVAVNLNNLASLLKATNRLSEAESLMCRALAIDEASYGQAHPATAITAWNFLMLCLELKSDEGIKNSLEKLVWLLEAKEEDLHHVDLRTVRSYLGQLLKRKHG